MGVSRCLAQDFPSWNDELSSSWFINQSTAQTQCPDQWGQLAKSNGTSQLYDASSWLWSRGWVLVQQKGRISVLNMEEENKTPKLTVFFVWSARYIRLMSIWSTNFVTRLGLQPQTTSNTEAVIWAVKETTFTSSLLKWASKGPTWFRYSSLWFFFFLITSCTYIIFSTLKIVFQVLSGLVLCLKKKKTPKPKQSKSW